jgi:hypothetical protein
MSEIGPTNADKPPQSPDIKGELKNGDTEIKNYGW